MTCSAVSHSAVLLSTLAQSPEDCIIIHEVCTHTQKEREMERVIERASE
jgi:hypothetical protein